MGKCMLTGIYGEMCADMSCARSHVDRKGRGAGEASWATHRLS